MYKLSLQRFLIIIGICLVGVFFAIPNMLPNQKNLPKWWQPVPTIVGCVSRIKSILSE